MSDKRPRVVICAEYQGEGAVEGSITGFQRSIEEWVNQAGKENVLDVSVYCMGLEDKISQHPLYANITIKQFKPNYSIRNFLPFVPPQIFPFLVDMAPVHPGMIKAIYQERPEVIHTFQTFGATDLSGFIAAKLLLKKGYEVRLVNTVMTEIDTYFADYLARMGNHFYEEYDAKPFGQILKECTRRESHSTLINSMGRGISTIGWYTIAKVFDVIRKRDKIVSFISNGFRYVLAREIRVYLNRCDAVTVSRKDDAARYGLLAHASVWEVPLACDLEKFRVYDPDIGAFMHKVQAAQQEGSLAVSGMRELERFVTDPDIITKRAIIYVGRLSDEKNVSLLIDAYEYLLVQETLKDKVHFIFIGSGVKAQVIEEKFGAKATVTGLVPNELLPDIYNFVRQRKGFFCSASDTETYGITHEEAAACGVPLVAMAKGTRGHLFIPGDQIGNQRIDEDTVIAKEVTTISACASEEKDLVIIGLNGIGVPDYSGSSGLSGLGSDHDAVAQAQKSMRTALFLMAALSDTTMQRMSNHASAMTRAARWGWDGTWHLFTDTVYPNNVTAYQGRMVAKKHVYAKHGL